MPHIHTKPGQHDLTVSAFIVRTDTKEPTLILHKHKKLNIYLQFGGHVELNENPWQALAHELQEESGYSLNQLKLLQPKKVLKKLDGIELHPYPLCINTHSFDENHSHIDIDYLFLADGPPKANISTGESEIIKYFTRSELMKLKTREIPRNIIEIADFIFDTAIKEWDQISMSMLT